MGAAVVIVGGLAAYFATRPPERIVETIEKPVEKTIVQTQVQTIEKPVEKVVTQTVEKPVERTIVTTVAGTPTTIVRTETLKETIERTVTSPVVRPTGQISLSLHKPPWLPGFQAVISQYEKDNVNAKISLSLEANIVTHRDKEVADALNKTGIYDIYTMVGLLHASILVYGGHTWPIKELDSDYKEDPELIYFDWLYHKGELAGLPLNVNNDLLFYRADLFKERGLKKPDTWEDVIEAAKTLHDPSKPIYGFVPRAADDPIYEWAHILTSFGGDFFVDWKNGDFSVRVNDQHGLAAAETFLELLKYAPPDPITITQSDMISYMASGKGLQALIVYAGTPWMDDPNFSIVPMKVDFTPPPKGTGLPGVGYGVIDGGSWALGISKYAKNKELAYDFAKFCTSFDAQLTFATLGVAPVRKDVANLPSLIENPKYRNLKAQGEALKHMKGSPSFPEISYIWNPMGKDFIQKLIRERRPKEVLNWFAEEIYKLLKEKGYKTSWEPLR
ncbi:Cyclodextrin-binding protein [archaeon HR06]|nr:Cyclodextrin-binding protein [archaeon HR06]